MVNLFLCEVVISLIKMYGWNEKLMKELVMCGLVTYFGAREVKDNYFPLESVQKNRTTFLIDRICLNN